MSAQGAILTKISGMYRPIPITITPRGVMFGKKSRKRKSSKKKKRSKRKRSKSSKRKSRKYKRKSRKYKRNSRKYF